MSIEEHVHHAFGNYNGMFLFTNSARQEDFWVFLGPLVGWGTPKSKNKQAAELRRGRIRVRGD